jgi:hypothetical protein
MGRKRKSVYSGFLAAEDVNHLKKDDNTFLNYWKRVKDNLFLLINPDEEDIVFLNREFKEIAKKFEGKWVKITIEEDRRRKRLKDDEMPDLDEKYEGIEKYKRILFNLFDIS